MKFTPYTEEEIMELDQRFLCPEGIYPYRVATVEDAISKSGNSYTKITLKVWDKTGKEYLIFTNMAFAKLLKHFCDVNGMTEQYKTGEISAFQFNHKSGGLVVIKIEPEKPNPNGGVYKAKNVVVDYVRAEGEVTIQTGTANANADVPQDFSDDIPF